MALVLVWQSQKEQYFSTMAALMFPTEPKED